MTRLKFHRRIVGGMTCDACTSDVTEVCHKCDTIICQPCHAKLRKHARSAYPKRREVVEKATNRDQIQVRAVGFKQCRGASGVHIMGDPTEREWQDALDTCERDGYRDIWVHYPNVVNLRHVVRQDDEAAS